VDQNRGQLGSILAAWECTQPSWRAEVEREIDLIEEVDPRSTAWTNFRRGFRCAPRCRTLPHYEAEIASA
jgi:phenylalanyl-tRNA synthetase beta subunit